MEVTAAQVVILLGILFFSFFSFFKMYWKKVQLPPGPTPWPFFGNILQKDVYPLFKFYKKLIQKYGPVFTIWMGSKPVVVFCGYETLKDVLGAYDQQFSGRPAFFVLEKILKTKGLSTTDEQKRKELRRFTLSTLTEFGTGKRSSEQVQKEALYLVEEITTTQGEPFDPTKGIRGAVANVLFSVLFGHRFDSKDENFTLILNTTKSIMQFAYSKRGLLEKAFPRILDYLPGKHRKIFANCKKLLAFIHDTVESHRQTLDLQKPRDYIDCFLIQSEKRQNSTADVYNTEELVTLIFGLFLAGIDTTNRSLLFIFLMLWKLPHIQGKVQKEIDEVVGTNRTPCMEDRGRMPFTNAVIHEALRHTSRGREVVLHQATCDTKFRGYSIPKDTIVLPLMVSVHSDPRLWETPERFNPGHFLDQKGQFKMRDAFMPFFAGRRSCPGEKLARMELFLFVTTLLQNFTFQLVGDATEKDITSLYEEFITENRCPPVRAIRRSM